MSTYFLIFKRSSLRPLRPLRLCGELDCYRERIRNGKGFTLLEIIVSLILVGIMAVLAGMGMVKIVEGFVFARMNAATVQKGQLALNRITKEFNNIAVSSGNSTSINYDSYSYKDGTKGSHSLLWAGTELLLDNDILTDNVHAFTLSYLDTYNGISQPTWSSASRVIDITLEITGANGIVSVFTMRVTPRNLW